MTVLQSVIYYSPMENMEHTHKVCPNCKTDCSIVTYDDDVYECYKCGAVFKEHNGAKDFF